jgi:hypothetical protein
MIPSGPEVEWYTAELRKAKQIQRRAERAWRKSGLEVHRQLYLAEKTASH